MGESLRACPICPACSSKKFTRFSGKKVIVKCRSCGKIIEI